MLNCHLLCYVCGRSATEVAERLTGRIMALAHYWFLGRLKIRVTPIVTREVQVVVAVVAGGVVRMRIVRCSFIARVVLAC